jgi:aspartyl aminopeptidase
VPSASTGVDARDLIAFIDASPSPFHAVAEVARRLEAAGFVEIDERAPWSAAGDGEDGAGEAQGLRFTRRGGSLVAWIAEPGVAPEAFRVLGAHTDSPNLRVKPQPDMASVRWRQLGVEVYGGALWSSWLDRDLGLSGRVGVVGPDGPELRLFRDDRALLRIPQLAIHLDRDVNQTGLRLNPQMHLTPVWGVGPTDAGAFWRYLAERVGTDADAVISWDVMVHDVVPGTISGVDGELISIARIDNLLSCWAATRAIAAAASGDDGTATRPAGVVPVIALFDHEEIGSASASGAASDVLGSTLERLTAAGGGDREAHLRALARSRLVSTDGAHATHPNYPERHDPSHLVFVNGGPVLKHNVNVRYATDAGTAAWFEAVCRDADVPVQHFVSRNDMPCGSTIGPITASRLGIATVDVGAAQLAMHSARELCGSDDPHWLRLALTACLAG